MATAGELQIKVTVDTTEADRSLDSLVERLRSTANALERPGWFTRMGRRLKAWLR